MGNPKTLVTKLLSRRKTDVAMTAFSAVSSAVLLLAWSIGAPLTAHAASYCASGQSQVGWYNTGVGDVLHWNPAPLNYFTTPASGHTTLCRLNEKVYQTWDYYEYAAVLTINGVVKESNDCVSTGGTMKGAYLVLGGCKAGQTDELFLFNSNTEDNWMVSWATDWCVDENAVGGPAFTGGNFKSTGGQGCTYSSDGTELRNEDWSVSAG